MLKNFRTELTILWLISALACAGIIAASFVLDYDQVAAGQLDFLRYQDRLSVPEDVATLRGMTRGLILMSRGEFERAAAMNPLAPALYAAMGLNALAGAVYITVSRVLRSKRS